MSGKIQQYRGSSEGTASSYFLTIFLTSLLQAGPCSAPGSPAETQALSCTRAEPAGKWFAGTGWEREGKSITGKGTFFCSWLWLLLWVRECLIKQHSEALEICSHYPSVRQNLPQALLPGYDSFFAQQIFSRFKVPKTNYFFPRCYWNNPYNLLRFEFYRSYNPSVLR